MANNFFTVDKDGTFMGGAISAYEDIFAGPTARNKDSALVPDPANVFANLDICEDIVVAGRHWCI